MNELASGAPTGRIERILPQRSRSSETTRLLLWFWLSLSHGVGVAEGWGKGLWERPAIDLSIPYSVVKQVLGFRAAIKHKLLLL